jgi:ACS family hexuronate transporter-like MFS transporter
MESAPSGNSFVSPLRWVAIGVFVMATALNYLDRQLLAASATMIKSEFDLSNVQYGQLIAAFSLVYAFAAPAAGLFVDYVGLRLGSIAGVVLWSIAGASTGLAQNFRMLLVSRIGLAIGESAGIPSSTKASATYLAPRELGMGTGVQSIGMTVGSVCAPLMVVALAPRFGWQSVFLISGALGLVWVPLWLYVSKRVPTTTSPVRRRALPMGEMLTDRRLWGFAIANGFVMTLYSLWMNWTTIYFVEERHLTLAQANQQFAWIPPVFATLGGFCGGWLAYRAIPRATDATKARLRICWSIAPMLLVTATIPLIPSTTLAAAAMAVSFFACLAVVNNLQMVPIDLFGPERAAFTGSLLTSSYAVMQAGISPIIGSLVDAYGFTVVCLVMSVLPLLGVGIAAWTNCSVAPRMVHAPAIG